MKTLLLSFYCFISVLSLGQEEPVIYGKVRNLSVSSSGKIWLTTATGNIYGLDSINGEWRTILEKNPGKSYDISAPNLDETVFINDELAIVYGYISDDFYNEKKGKILKTSDGGKGWYSIRFTDNDCWVREAQLLGNGDLFLCGSDGNIYYSSDHGNSWIETKVNFKKQKEAHDRKPEVYSMCFLNDSVGIATNRDNLLAFSEDRFETFRLIPTPLDQGLFEKRYKPLYLNGSGRKYVNNWNIDKVRIFKDWLIIMQNDKAYYSKKDSINWQAFSQDIVDFDLTEKGELYLYDVNATILKAEEDLTLSIVNSLLGEEVYLDFVARESGVYLLIPEHSDRKPKDVVRETYGDLTVVEKNVKRVSGYIIYKINGDKIQSRIIQAE